MRFYKIKYSQCLYFLLHSKEESAVTSGRHGGEQFLCIKRSFQIVEKVKEDAWKKKLGDNL